MAEGNMKAVVCPKYGPPEVLQLREVTKPLPGDREVLIKVHATTCHIGDTKVRRFKSGLGDVQDIVIWPLIRLMLGFRGPRNKIRGMELAGDWRYLRYAAGDLYSAGHPGSLRPVDYPNKKVITENRARNSG